MDAIFSLLVPNAIQKTTTRIYPESIACYRRLEYGGKTEIIGIDELIPYPERNLLLNSNFNDSTHWAAWISPSSSVTVANNTITVSSAISSGQILLQKERIDMIEGEVYTLSALVRSDTIKSLNYNYATGIKYNQWIRESPQINSEWQRVSVTVTIAIAQPTTVAFGWKGVGEVQFQQIQLTKNNTDTPYSPAPEDAVITMNGTDYIQGAVVNCNTLTESVKWELHNPINTGVAWAYTKLNISDISIVSSPTYQKYINGVLFDYNVVGGLSTVSYQFKSLQAPLKSITQYGPYALLELRTNINDYLQQVASTTGKSPMIYIDDTLREGFDYSRSYKVEDIKTSDRGNSLLMLKNPTGNSPTFFGEKNYPDGYASQAVYRHRVNLTYEVYDVTPENNMMRNALLVTRRQQLSISGYSWFNISELAKGYLSTSGGVALKVMVVATDYFGNTQTVNTEPCVLVSARVPEVNYNTLTLFNPESKGLVLPTTGHKLLYNDNGVYPFYVNFVVNTLAGLGKVSASMTIGLCVGGSVVSTTMVDISLSVGLNIINLSQYHTLVASIIRRKPDSIQIKIRGQSFNTGEFSSQFSGQFVLSSQGWSGESATYEVPCRQYTLDDRRDFYFSYQNGMGGLSTYLCREYTRKTEPELVALRNASTISNAVARETEYVDLAFKYTDISGLQFLLGYDLGSSVKYDGIYESTTINRIDSKGRSTPFIIKGTMYELPNSTLYKDLYLTIYRPIGMDANY